MIESSTKKLSVSKTKKVVLFFPKLEEYKPAHWFPMSLLSISAPMIEKGFEVVIVDERVNENWKENLLIECKDAILFGVSSFTGYQLIGAYAASKLIKKTYPDLKIFWGGPHVSSLARQTLENENVDICVVGYGDLSTIKMLEKIHQGENPDGIKGILYKENGKIYGDGEPEAHPDLSNLPQINYDLIDIHKYINPETKAFVYLSSYGCPGICTFCSTKELRKYIKLSPEKVIKDIQNLLNRYNFKKLVMFDATFFVDEENVRQIVSYIIESNQIKEWVCDGRAVDMLKMSDDTFDLLEKSNLKAVVIGLETGSQRIVNIMKKGATHLERYKKIIERLKDYSFDIYSGVIFGMPGETIEDLKLTLQYLEDMKKINPKLNYSTTFFQALPGTEMFDHVQKEMGIKFPTNLVDWVEYGKGNHYVYNQATKAQYLNDSVRDEYLKIYNEFWNKHKDWLV